MADDQIDELVEVLIRSDGVEETESEMEGSVQQIKSHWTDALKDLDLGSPDLTGLVNTWINAFETLKKARPSPDDLLGSIGTLADKLEPVIGNLDFDSIFDLDKLIDGNQGDIDEIAGSYWTMLFDALRANLPDDRFKETVQVISDGIEKNFKPPVLPPPIVGSNEPNVVMPGPGKVTGYPTGIKTSDLLEPLSQIEQVMKDFRLPGLDLSSIITGGVEAPDLEDIMGSLNPREIENLLLDVTELQDRLNQLNVNPDILAGINAELDDYVSRLTSAAEMQKKLSDEIGDTHKDGQKTEAFLGRYKYSLLLVGGAISGIMGMIKYSTTFSTIIDLIGVSIGYLADVILYPLLPAFLFLVELIIGAADWFSDLPDPIKMVISALFGLAAGFMLLKALGITGFFADILKGIGNLLPALTVAGALTTTGLIIGIIAGLAAGFAVVYLMVQTGVTNAIATAGRTMQEKAPWLTDILATVLAPIGILGAIVIDLVTGQWDKIPEHIGSIMQIWLNSVTALGARIIWVFQQIGNAVMILIVGSFAKAGEAIGGLISGFGDLASSTISSIDAMTKSYRGWIKLIGEGLNAIGMTTLGNPMVAFGNATEGISGMKQTADDLKSYGEGVSSFWKSIGDATGPAADDASSRWENLWKEMESKNADLLKLNQGEFQPGSVLNGFTSSDQISALTKQYREELLKTIKQTNADLNFAGIDEKIATPELDSMDLSGYQEMINQLKKIQDETLKTIDTQNDLNEVGKTNSSLTLDRLKEIEKGVTDLNNVASVSTGIPEIKTGTGDIEKTVTAIPEVKSGTESIPTTSDTVNRALGRNTLDELEFAELKKKAWEKLAARKQSAIDSETLKPSEQLYRGGSLPTSGSPAPEPVKPEYVYVGKGDKTSDEPRVLQVNITGRFSNDEELYQQFIKKLSRESRFSV